MIPRILLNKILFHNDVFSKINCDTGIFKEILDKKASDHVIKNKIEKLNLNYHNFVLYMPLEILKNDSLTLSSFKQNDQKTDIFKTMIQLFSKFIHILIKHIMNANNNEFSNKKMKYTYLFNSSNMDGVKDYDHVIIIFSISKSMISTDSINDIQNEFINITCGNGTLMNRIIKKNDFKNFSKEKLNFAFHCYYLYFFKKNDSILNSFFPSRSSQRKIVTAKTAKSSIYHGSSEKHKIDYFSQFCKTIFYFKNKSLSKCIIQYLKFNTLKHAYRIKNFDYNFIISMDMCNIMLPKSSKILEKTMAKIKAIRDINYDMNSSLACSSTDDHSIKHKKQNSYLEELNLLLASSNDSDISTSSQSIMPAMNDKDEKITINRLLFKYHQEIKSQFSLLFQNHPRDLEKMNTILNKMIFKFYCMFSRSPDCTLSTVGESIHRERINNNINTRAMSKNTIKYNKILQNKYLNNMHYYDVYRLLTSYQLINTFSCRPYLISIFEIILENSISIYNPTKNLANNIFLIGDPAAGKDFLLELLESILIPKTMIKESRVSPCAESSESHGRHDDEILFNTEKSMHNLMDSRKYNGSGDTHTKDLLTSARSVSRVLTFGPKGSRITKTIINEKNVMMYNAANPSLVSKIDKGIFERFIWIPMNPTTFTNTMETVNLIIKKKVNSSTTESSSKEIIFKNDQRFIQMASYELSKMTNLCSNDNICQSGALYIIQYILECLNKDMFKFGCMPIKQRKIENILTLAKCHTIRRNVIKTFFVGNGNEYNPKIMYKNIIKNGKLYVKLRDLIISFGQLSPYIGIFSNGELQIITALRRIFIKKNYNLMKNGLFDIKNNRNFAFSRKKLNYIKFPNNLKELAKLCMENILKIWKKEEDAINPMNQDMFEDCLKQLFIIPEEKKIDINYISKEYVNINYNCHDQILYLDDSPKAGMMKEPTFEVTKKYIYVHVMYLTRLCDPLMQYYPWTKEYPKKWNPIITEDYLLKQYFDHFVSLKYQDKSKKIVYKIKRKRLSENDFFAEMDDEHLSSMKYHDFDFIEGNEFFETNYFIINRNMNNDIEKQNSLSKRSFERFNQNNIQTSSLKMNIDKLSKLSIKNSISDILKSKKTDLDSMSRFKNKKKKIM